MKWHDINKEPLPATDKDINLLVKTLNVPMQYCYVVWDGKILYMFSGYDDCPWMLFPDYVKITDWALIDE